MRLKAGDDKIATVRQFYFFILKGSGKKEKT